MKKISNLSLVLLITALLFTGCSNTEKADEKTEEELKAQIRAEIEKEQATSKTDKQTKRTNSRETQISLNKNSLIETFGNNYYKFKTDTNVYFDIDCDGTDEKIKYDTSNSKLMVTGYDSIDIALGQEFSPESFIIVKYTDEHTNMNMIGIFDQGPSADPVTTFYSIISSGGNKSLKNVGKITAEIINKSDYKNPYDFYDFSKKPSAEYLAHTEDFMSKAFLIDGKGMEAPFMISDIIPQIWFGRTLFTYDSASSSLIDNNKKHLQNYTTYSVLTVSKDVKSYERKDINSSYQTIKTGQNVLLYATDNKEWIAVEAEDGTKGWIHADYITHENFEGLVIFG